MMMKAIVIDIYLTMIVIVIWYHDTDHDDDGDCDAEESGESKEGGYSTQPTQCPLIGNPISFIDHK